MTTVRITWYKHPFSCDECGTYVRYSSDKGHAGLQVWCDVCKKYRTLGGLHRQTQMHFAIHLAYGQHVRSRFLW